MKTNIIFDPKSSFPFSDFKRETIFVETLTMYWAMYSASCLLRRVNMSALTGAGFLNWKMESVAPATQWMRISSLTQTYLPLDVVSSICSANGC